MSITAVIMPPAPWVLPYPGVPMLSGSVGVGWGAVPGAQVGAGVSFGPGGISAGIGGALPFPGGGILQGGLTINPDGTLSADLTAGMPGAAALVPFTQALNASLPPLLTSDSDQLGVFAGRPTWGIFDENNNQVADWDSVIKIDYRHEMRIADFPIEQGGFASYNKVQVPFDARISFVVGGNVEDGGSRRKALLDSLEAAVTSLSLYTVITPDALYPRANLVHMEYSRQAQRGVNLLVVDVWVQEVRQAAGAAFTTADQGQEFPQSPTSQPATNSGGVQAEQVDQPFDEPIGNAPADDPNLGPPMPTLGSGAQPSNPAPPEMPKESAPRTPPATEPPNVPPTGTTPIPGIMMPDTGIIY